MQRSKVIGMFLCLAPLGILALGPMGCSSDDSLASSPDLGLAGWGNDGSPPATPTGLSVIKATEQGFKLSWSPNAEGDLEGYQVYVYDPSPYREGAYRCVHGASLLDRNQTYCVYTDDLSFGSHYFQLAAVDADGNTSERTAPYEFCYTGAQEGHDATGDGDASGDLRPGASGAPGNGRTYGDDTLEGDDTN